MGANESNTRINIENMSISKPLQGKEHEDDLINNNNILKEEKIITSY